MSRIKQEISAGRIQYQRYHAGFDKVLPPDARAELRIPPKRPRILGRKSKEPTKLSTPRLLFAAFLLLLIVSAICSVLRQRIPQERLTQAPRDREPTSQSITLAPTPAPTPQAPVPVPIPSLAPESSPALTLDTLMPQITSPQPEHSPSATADGTTTPDSDWHSLPVLPVPRATLIKLPPPRAQLVGLPLRIGAQYTVHMPYQNLEVLATFKGYLERENLLPTLNNQAGDMYIVDQTPWLWLQAPGADHLDWIDP